MSRDTVGLSEQDLFASNFPGAAYCSPHRLKRPPLTRRLIAMPHPSHATAPASHATSLPVAREPLRTVHSHDAGLTRSTSIPCKFWHAPCSLQGKCEENAHTNALHIE